MKENIENVITEIVKKGLCSGCGVCAGISEKCLEMVFDKNGQLVPKVSNCNNCGNCLSVCPFANTINNNNPLSSPLGKHLKNYVGFSAIEEERIKGSSGGLATRLLRTLLEKRIVEGVVVVGSSKKEDRFFEPVIVKNYEEIIGYAGSKYYPIEFSSILKMLKKERGEYAIIGLPCVIKALRLVQRNYPSIGKKIKYLFGLTCGHNKNKNYTSFLISLTEAKEKDLKTVQFRCKENTDNANNFGFRGILKNGRNTKQLNFSDSLVGKLWCNYFFSTNACFYCEDLFARYADISFMDAWLKPYMDDPKGTSIVVIRNEELKDLVEKEMHSGSVILNPIDEEDVVESQEGAWNFKKTNIENKKNFLFNKWLSGKFYSDGNFNKKIGSQILKLYIFFSQKYKLLKIFLYKLIKTWRIT